jgi:hypothetical protein
VGRKKGRAGCGSGWRGLSVFMKVRGKMGFIPLKQANETASPRCAELTPVEPLFGEAVTTSCPGARKKIFDVELISSSQGSFYYSEPKKTHPNLLTNSFQL